MKKEYLVAGFGGQGILLFGHILAYAAVLAGKETTWVPSYGPEMRGGTANCMVVIADSKISCPLVYEPDVAVIFNKPSLEKYCPNVKEGGAILLLSDLIETSPARTDLRSFQVPAKTIAEQMGESIFLNMVMLGKLLQIDNVVELYHVIEAIKNIIPHHRQHLVASNIEALERGFAYMGT